MMSLDTMDCWQSQHVCLVTGNPCMSNRYIHITALENSKYKLFQEFIMWLFKYKQKYKEFMMHVNNCMVIWLNRDNISQLYRSLLKPGAYSSKQLL